MISLEKDSAYDANNPKIPDSKAPEAAKKRKQQLTPQKQTAVYVSGLPSNVTIEELAAYFCKAGILLTDYETGAPKIKLYKDESGLFKGDALVLYFREESVQLAVDLLDKSDLRPGVSVHVSRAEFQERSGEEEDAAKTRKKKKIDKKAVKRHMEELRKKLDWGEDEVDVKKLEKYKRILLLKYMFKPSDLEKDPTLIFDLKQEIADECENFGKVQNVQLYDAMEEGYCTVKFEDAESVDNAIPILHGRYFDGQRIEAMKFDGSIKLRKSQDTIEEAEKRLERFGQWLEGNDIEGAKSEQAHEEQENRDSD